MTPDRAISPKWILWVGLAVFAAAIGIAAPELARSLFSAGGLLPHGVCYSWFPGLLWLHVVSDVMIGLAYFSIPVALVYFVRRRADLPFNWIFVLFGIFIVACGATHWMDVWTLWYPHYWLSGTVKAVTAAASVPTAIATVMLIPHALSIPSTSALRGAKDALEAEVVERRRAEEALRTVQVELERRVDARTAELSVANAALQRLAADAERANRSKDVFLATLSHELRTPLQAMLGWVQLLDTGRLGEAQQRRAIERIGYNVRAQAQLINDLLDVSRIVTGKLRLAIEPVDPAAVVDAAIDTLRPAAEAKEIRVSRSAGGAVPRIAADPDRLRQVLVNLLSNAVKFTPDAGAVEVGLKVEGRELEISVRDNGQGIDPVLLPLVFERFTQGRGPQQGLGLGLAIVRNLVELHGGTVRAASEGPGRGATFTVRLPIGEAPAANVATGAHVAAAGRPLEGVRVLVVEDVDDARETLVGGLADHGAVAEGAADVAAAIERLIAAKPAVVVSDIGLPIEDGYALIARVRALGDDVPVIAVTAFGTNEDRDRALAAGFAEHLTKPVGLGELVRAVQRVLRRSRA